MERPNRCPSVRDDTVVAVFSKNPGSASTKMKPHFFKELSLSLHQTETELSKKPGSAIAIPGPYFQRFLAQTPSNDSLFSKNRGSASAKVRPYFHEILVQAQR
jgi:hypothetical protein